jgi:hypothetical protein
MKSVKYFKTSVKILLLSLMTLMMTGCGDEIIGIGFLNGPPSDALCSSTYPDLCKEYPECPDCPVCDECGPPYTDNSELFSKVLDANFANIDKGSVKINHYIDEVRTTGEPFINIINYYLTIDAAQAELLIPAYNGSPIKHLLVIEFTQTQ